MPPRAVSVPLKFQREGIRYDGLSEDEKDQWDAADWNEDGERRDEVDPDDVNKWLFNKDTVDKVLETLMTRGEKVAGGDRLGKTIIFAKNNHHADFIAERFNARFPEQLGGFARVITYQSDYAQSLIDDFSNKDKAPHIAISVDMLDTGIDIPQVVNLVFFKRVHSKTKYWQMIGRGTRLCRDLYGPGRDKTHFFIFDFCQNIEFFNQNPETSDGALAVPLGQRLFTMLEQARIRVRSLVRLLDTTKRKIVYTDFEDQLGDVDEITITPGAGQVDIARFRAKARDFLCRHENHLALHKLRRNAPLTAADLAELERMLSESGELDDETLSRSVQEADGLGLFIRSLVGLDHAAAVDAMSGFLDDKTLCANQIEFITMIVEHLTRQGTMTAAQLYEPPFTDIAPRGPDILFPPERLNDLIVLLDDVTARASAS